MSESCVTEDKLGRLGTTMDVNEEDGMRTQDEQGHLDHIQVVQWRPGRRKAIHRPGLIKGAPDTSVNGRHELVTDGG